MANILLLCRDTRPMFSAAGSGGAPPYVPDFYVSLTGGTGTGSINDPWSLTYAVGGAGGKLTPGKTVAIRAGTYGSGGPNYNFVLTVAGTAGNPIKFRNYPNERVIINGSILNAGSYVWFQGDKRNFIMRNTDHTTAGQDRDNLENRCPYSKLINIIVHDARGNGIGNFQEATDSELNGIINFNNGNLSDPTGGSHGIYTTTLTGDTNKLVKGSVVFHNAAYNFHCAAAGTQWEKNVHLTQCLGFNPSAPQTAGFYKSNYVFHTTNQTSQPPICTMDFSYSYCDPTTIAAQRSAGAGDVVTLGAGNGGTLNMADNWIMGNTQVESYQNFSYLRNHTWRTNRELLLDRAPASFVSFSANNNTYRQATSYGDTPFSAAGTGYTLAGWQVLGVDAASTLVADANGIPVASSNIFVVPVTDYEPKRALIIIYNWALASSIDIDLSSIFTVGDLYEIHNVQALSMANGYSDPNKVSGSYAGVSVTLPMTGITAVAPLDRSFRALPVTGPLFNAFLAHLA